MVFIRPIRSKTRPPFFSTQLGYDQVIESKLGVMDANAIVLCRGQDMPIRVFNVFGEGNLVPHRERRTDRHTGFLITHNRT